MSFFIGIDIGSSSAKAAVVDETGALLHTLLRPTGWDSAGAAQALAEDFARLHMDVQQEKVVATGYGRNAVAYAGKRITEITCHGRGAYWLFGAEAATVIDIGGQDSKIMRIEHGKVRDFMMNDKCSAGTGRFLEIMSAALGISIDELCDLAATGGGVHISSMCTVFAESEVVGLIGKGTARADIAYAIVDSIVQKVCAQAAKLISDEPVFLTGGLCKQENLIRALGQRLGKPLVSHENARFAGAIGAALLAAER
ncbi:MAG: acyl-CoA dehydratase activase [Firmicutes bacterium]|nr:acyl-CoA dehydratase activase [Bacillota bacterium]